MFNTFRVRLTLWWVGALAVLLVVFSAGVYSLLARSVRDRFDSTLHSAGEVTAMSVNHELEEHQGRAAGEPSIRQVLETMHQVSFSRQSIAVFEGARQVAMKHGVEGLASLTPAPADGFHDVAAPAGEFRIATFTVPVPSLGAAYRVVVSQSTRSLEQELAGFRRILYLCVPLGLLLAAAGGYFLARRNLAPIVAMSAEVNRITSQSLHQRVAVVNPNDELGHLAATFNELLERLNASFEAHRRFMADASHELRTPISVALTAAQVNLDGPEKSTADYQDALRIVAEQMRRLKRIVQDMFLLAQVDSGGIEPSITPFYLEELIAESVRAARVIGGPRDVRVEIDAPHEAQMEGDEGLLRQLVLILLDNAIRHTPDGGRVTVSLAREGGEWRVDVADTGAGIPEADQPYIFDRFYRVNKARSAGGGAGLGLSIARWIAALHKGTLTLTASSAAGTTFTLRLPVNS